MAGFCTNCGSQLWQNTKVCAYCQHEQPPQAAQPATPGAYPHQEPGFPSGPEAVLDLETKITRLRRELESVEEALEFQSFGFYRPKYGFENSAEYSARLAEIREKLKALLRRNAAWESDSVLAVDGSVAKGKKVKSQQAKLMLRAFNGEADAAIAKVKYDNVEKLETRIFKSCEAINKLGHAQRVQITSEYFHLKIQELYLVHEHREKVHEEKELEREQREQLREEERAQKQIEKALLEAEKEELRNQQALEKARKELGDATGKQHEKLEALVTKLEQELSAAIDQKAKAVARAQLTRSGYVYVLSNVGSFGKGVYKIGLTRRLDPLERVRELGDASVPFFFDVHAIVFSKDAPALEKALHDRFADRRVNLVNMRREFFRVPLGEIQAVIGELHGPITMVTEPEAEDYRKTCAILDEATLNSRQQ